MAKTWNDSVKLILKDCFFGNNGANVYNFIEMTCKLADGSEISNNTWTAGSFSHNAINIYGADDSATIKINDNEFEKSANAVRIGTRGAVAGVKIEMNRNKYETTEDDDWAGLFLIQPYAKATTDMSGITIECNDTDNESDKEQIGYYWHGNNDAQLDIAHRPVVYIDNVKMTYSDKDVNGATWGGLVPE